MNFARLLWPTVVAVLGTAFFFLRATAGQDADPGTIPLRLIVVNSAVDAGKILEQLESGADFGVLAREKSVDATSVDGGFLGSVDPTTLRAELRDALRDLQPGRISRVFKLPSGFAILKVLPRGEVSDLENTERARRFAVSAEGSVQFDFDISGLNETQAALAAFPKPDDWYLDLAGACGFRKQSLTALKERLEKLLDPKAAGNAGLQPYDVMSVRVAKGQLYAYYGEMDRAIE